MRKIRCGIIGFGFVGPHHLDAIRRLGFVEVTTICTQHAEQAAEKARQHNVPKSCGDYRELLADPHIEAVDIVTPTHMHHPIAVAALEHGKHVTVDKPMALNAAQAVEMLLTARRAKKLGAITFNIRGNPLIQQARAMVGKEELGPIHLIQGRYLQEWLLRDTDFSWRLEAEKCGPSAMIAEAGAHWFDLSQFVTGLKIVKLRADLSTTMPVRKKPRDHSADAFSTSSAVDTNEYNVMVPDLGFVVVEYNNGARGIFTSSAMCAGRKNDLRLEINGSKASLEWRQEKPNELWVGYRGKPNQIILKDPSLLDDSVRSYAALPGGHNEGWADAFRNLMRNIFTFIAEDRDPASADGIAFPTFQTGWQINCITDAIHKSHLSGGPWVDVKQDPPQ
ncbi:MAG TPA: Gfo/Idh/MocA family oxidoreductase [Verrucomicrobiae bacterium]|jgi:predicted dehydrogenase